MATERSAQQREPLDLPCSRTVSRARMPAMRAGASSPVWSAMAATWSASPRARPGLDGGDVGADDAGVAGVAVGEDAGA